MFAFFISLGQWRLGPVPLARHPLAMGHVHGHGSGGVGLSRAAGSWHWVTTADHRKVREKVESGIRLGGAVPRMRMWPLSQFEIEVEPPTSRREIKRTVYSLSLHPLFSPRSLLSPHPRPPVPFPQRLSRPGACFAHSTHDIPHTTPNARISPNTASWGDSLQRNVCAVSGLLSDALRVHPPAVVGIQETSGRAPKVGRVCSDPQFVSASSGQNRIHEIHPQSRCQRPTVIFFL